MHSIVGLCAWLSEGPLYGSRRGSDDLNEEDWRWFHVVEILQDGLDRRSRHQVSCSDVVDAQNHIVQIHDALKQINTLLGSLGLAIGARGNSILLECQNRRWDGDWRGTGTYCIVIFV